MDFMGSNIVTNTKGVRYARRPISLYYDNVSERKTLVAKQRNIADINLLMKRFRSAPSFSRRPDPLACAIKEESITCKIYLPKYKWLLGKDNVQETQPLEIRNKQRQV